MSKAEVIQAYERYVQAFLAEDLATIVRQSLEP